MILYSFIFYQIILYLNTWRINFNNENLLNSANLCSFVNAIIITSYSLGLLFTIDNIFTPSITLFNYTTYHMIILTNMLVGYFLSDIVYLILFAKKNKNTIAYLVHHIIFSLILFWINYIEKYHFLTIIVLLTEASSIIINIFQYYRYYAKYYKNNSMYENNIISNIIAYILFILFIITFIFTRFILILYLVINYLEIIWNNEPLLLIFVTFIISLNTLWLKDILHVFFYYKFI